MIVTTIATGPLQEDAGSGSPLLLLTHHGIDDVTDFLQDADVLRLRAINTTFHAVFTRGPYKTFWNRRLLDAPSNRRKIFDLIERLRDGEDFINEKDERLAAEYFDFYRFLLSHRLSNRFKTTTKNTSGSSPVPFRIKVCARFRPQKSPSPPAKKPPFINDHFMLVAPNNLVCTTNCREWTLDRFLTPDTTAQDTFRCVAGERVQDLLCGLNGCILAYGQTGTGKTHTILGRNGQMDGILPMSVMMILDLLQAEKDAVGTLFGLSLSVCEVYRERSRDLLDCEELSSMQDLEQALERVNSQRVTGTTAMNKQSSRSHCLFTLHLWQHNFFKYMQSELKIVDLAGSERLKRARLEEFEDPKDRMKEGIAINLSLSCLGRVINSMATGARHIPYNDSLLTRLLRSALGGGDGRTNKNRGSSTFSIVNCCSSDTDDFQETLSTLRFAQTASRIRLASTTSAAPKEVKSLVLLQTKLMRVETEMRHLQYIWTHAGEDRHRNCEGHCWRCQQVVVEGRLLDPTHMPRWGRLAVEREGLVREINVLQSILVQRSRLQATLLDL